MDHGVLKEIIRRTIRCQDTLRLSDQIIDGSNPQDTVCTVFPGDDLARAGARRVGLPIGNLTSQWFGCIYLSAFDHWVKETLGCPGYVRYVDDFLLFSNDKARLREWRLAIAGKLAEFRLRLNERKSRAFPSGQGVTFLGQIIWPERRRLCRQNVSDARRRLKWNVRQFKKGCLSKTALVTRWSSWRGHAAQANGGALIQLMRKELQEELCGDGKPVADRRSGTVADRRRGCGSERRPVVGLSSQGRL
jgi:hypothetical protein